MSALANEKPEEMSDDALLATPVGFAMEILGIDLYQWQADVLSWYEESLERMVMGTLCTPNGAGKDAVVIASLSLWWVFVHSRGRVVITSKDARQIDEQTYPALSRHRGKFPDWKFIDRHIETPTGGKIILFTTDEPGRAEGFHKDTLPDGTPDPDGPVLIIANEAKSIQEEIFTAFDRCTFNGLLYASSAGMMTGRFYDSHQRAAELGFRAKKIGLLDCPHIPKEKIDRIIAQHGPDSPKTRSILHGEFLLDGASSRFDFEGLKHLRATAEAGQREARRGVIVESRGSYRWMPDDNGWCIIFEPPKPGLSYLAFGDPSRGEQAEGSEKRDSSACGILRDAYLDQEHNEHREELAAVLHADDGVKWDIDVVAWRLHALSQLYGGCTIVPEANIDSLIIELRALGAPIWQREDLTVPGRRLKKPGFLTTAKSKRAWVERIATAIREKALGCKYLPAVSQMESFIEHEDGSCGARPGAHDDWVAGIAIGLLVGCYSKFPLPVPTRTYASGAPTSKHGSGAVG